MRSLGVAGILVMLATASAAAEPISEYTDLVADRDCIVVGKAAEGDGDWVNFVCSGYKGYPVILSYADARESIFYGFPPEGGAGFAWESFSPFNAAGPRIEWRIDRTAASEIPYATIHRWSVSDPEDESAKTEVLVVEKVGLLPERQSCAVGYVMASGNPAANEQARRIADEQARDFVCGDQPTVMSADRAMPEFAREAN